MTYNVFGGTLNPTLLHIQQYSTCPPSPNTYTYCAYACFAKFVFLIINNLEWIFMALQGC